MTDLKARARAKRLAEERRLASLANDTKWGEFFAEIARLEIPLQLKILYEDEPYPARRVWIPATNYLDSTDGPNLFVFVEWVRSSAVEEVALLARRAGLEHTIRDSHITVYGYR